MMEHYGMQDGGQEENLEILGRCEVPGGAGVCGTILSAK